MEMILGGSTFKDHDNDIVTEDDISYMSRFLKELEDMYGYHSLDGCACHIIQSDIPTYAKVGRRWIDVYREWDDFYIDCFNLSNDRVQAQAYQCSVMLFDVINVVLGVDDDICIN